MLFCSLLRFPKKENLLFYKILANLCIFLIKDPKKYILKNTEIWPPQAKILWTPLQANNEGVLSTLHL